MNGENSERHRTIPRHKHIPYDRRQQKSLLQEAIDDYNSVALPSSQLKPTPQIENIIKFPEFQYTPVASISLVTLDKLLIYLNQMALQVFSPKQLISTMQSMETYLHELYQKEYQVQQKYQQVIRN